MQVSVFAHRSGSHRTRAGIVVVAFAAAAASLVAVGSSASAATPQTNLVSRSSAGIPVASSVFYLAMSANGRYVLFNTDSTAFSPSGPVTGAHLARRDLVTGTTVPVDVTPSGGLSTGGTIFAAISADGRYVAFQSISHDLVSPPFATDLLQGYWRDMSTGVTKLFTADLTGGPGSFPGGLEDSVTISGDGRYVAFAGWGNGLVRDAIPDCTEVYLRDMVAGVSSVVSRTAADRAAPCPNHEPNLEPMLSSSGQYIAFSSFSNQIVPNGPTGTKAVYVRNLATRTNKLVSLTATGQPFGDALTPHISSNGQRVLFTASSTFGAGQDVYVRDLAAGTTTLVSALANGSPSTGARFGDISTDGRYAVFASGPTGFLPGPPLPPFQQVYERNLTTGGLELVSRNTAGAPANDTSGVGFSTSLSRDGSSVVFDSFAGNIIAANPQHRERVFVRIMR